MDALFEPTRVWHWIAERRARPGAAGALLALAMLGGLVVAVATEIGVRVFHTDWNYVAGYSVQHERGWWPFAMLWASATALPLAQGLAGAWLLPMYGRPRDWGGGLAVGVVGSVPIYVVAPTLVLLPGILVVGVAYLVSCSWWGSGGRLLLGLPTGEATEHVVASIIVASLTLSTLSGAVPLF